MTFGAVEVGAFFYWLYAGRDLWFRYDDWDFLAARSAGNLGDLFRPHNEHWVTVPILAYRLLYAVVGLHTYLPYRVLVVLVHLVIAALLLVIMRRLAIRPWLATAAASMFVLFGNQPSDIILPFQVCFSAALALGLTQLLLVDHDGPIARRDFLGLLAGFVGLLCSGIAVPMVVAVGITALLRRGWRPALLQTAPLAACYVLWYATVGHSGYRTQVATPGDLLSFVGDGFRRTSRALVQISSVGGNLVFLALFLGVVVFGLVLAFNAHREAGRLTELALPGALLAASVLLLAITGAGRAGFPPGGLWGRFIYLVLAMQLPALALAANALADRWRWFLPVAIALFLVGIPGNMHAGIQFGNDQRAFNQSTRALILSLAHSPSLASAPSAIHPEPVHAAPVTAGWLRDAVAQHRMPGVPVPDRHAEESAFRLSIVQQRGRIPKTGCRVIDDPLYARINAGDVITFTRNLIEVEPNTAPFAVRPPLLYFPSDGRRLVALKALGPIVVQRVTDPRGTLNWRADRELTKAVPRVCIVRAPTH